VTVSEAGKELSEMTPIAGAALAAGDLFPVLDVSDTSQASTGTNKSIRKDQLAIAVGGGAGLTVVRYPFAWDTANIADGILIATVDAGSVYSNAGCVSISTMFNGSTPFFSLGTSQAAAVAGGNMVSFSITAPNGATGNNWQQPYSDDGPYLAVGGAGQIWLAITDGASGPDDSTAGAGEVVLLMIDPA
jgi:hypothetical protein